jgi:hypothetical protein
VQKNRDSNRFVCCQRQKLRNWSVTERMSQSTAGSAIDDNLLVNEDAASQTSGRSRRIRTPSMRVLLAMEADQVEVKSNSQIDTYGSAAIDVEDTAAAASQARVEYNDPGYGSSDRSESESASSDTDSDDSAVAVSTAQRKKKAPSKQIEQLVFTEVEERELWAILDTATKTSIARAAQTINDKRAQGGPPLPQVTAQQVKSRLSSLRKQKMCKVALKGVDADLTTARVAEQTLILAQQWVKRHSGILSALLAGY